MKFKSTWIVIAVFLGLGAYLYFVEEPRHQAQQEAKESEGLLFPGLDTDAVTELSLAGSRGPVRVKRGEDGKWFVAEPWDDRADDGRVRTLLTDLKGLKGQREVAAADADLAPFGLGEPELTVKALGAPLELTVGAENPAGDARYVRAGKGPVQLASAAGLSALLGEPSELRSKDVLEGFPWTRLATVEVRRPGGETLRLAKAGEAWTLEQPVSAQGDPDAVSRLTEKLHWARVARFLDEDPAAVDARLSSGTAVLLRAEGGEEATLSLAEVDGAVWAARTGRNAIFTLGKDVLDAVAVPADALRRKKPVLVKSWKTDKLSLSLDGTALAYEKADGAWTRGGAKVEGTESTALQDYLRTLESGAAAEVLDPPADPAGYGLDAPGLTATVTDTDGGEQRLAAARRGEDVFARAGDAGPVYRMPAEYWDKAQALVAATRPAAAPAEPKPEGPPAAEK